jgi:hypothetical protein
LKRRSSLILLTFLLGLGIAGCDSSEVDEPRTCNLATSDTIVPAGMSVTYRATKTGDGSISSLSYGTNDGLQQVTNPALPFTQTVTLGAGTHALMSATGTVRNGMLKIEFTGSSSTGGTTTTIEDSDSCSQTSS